MEGQGEAMLDPEGETYDESQQVIRLHKINWLLLPACLWSDCKQLFVVWWDSSNKVGVCVAVEMNPLTHSRWKLISIQQPRSVTHFVPYWISIALHTCPPLLLHTISAAHMQVIVSWEMKTEASSSQSCTVLPMKNADVITCTLHTIQLPLKYRTTQMNKYLSVCVCVGC